MSGWRGVAAGGASGQLLLLAILSAASVGSVSASVAVGYTARACGFDMNRDGVIGGVGDCSVCDGATADPDGDGVAEDINYLDASAGVDNTTCGAAASPCASLAWVLAGANSSFARRVDGASGDPEDIVCVKGIHTLGATQTISVSGAAGSYPADLYPNDDAVWGASRSESYRYPSDPLMIVGWDADGDGSYPPVDADDTAELVADPTNKLVRALYVAGNQIEIAHLTWTDFGEGDTNGTTATGFVGVGPATHFLYLHDLVLRDVNRASRQNSGRVLVSLFNADQASYLAFVNNSVERMGGYGFRGSCDACTDVRVDHNTATFEGVNETLSSEPGVTWYRAWSTMDRVSVSYNDLDADPQSWLPSGNTVVLGIAVSICTRDVTVRGNRLRDFREGLRVRLTTSAGECDSRSVTGVVFDANTAYQTYAPYTFDRHLWIEAGNTAAMVLEDLVFTNNVLAGTTTMQDAVLVWGGNDATDFSATHHFLHNTIVGDFFGSVFNFERVKAHNPDAVLENNLFAGTAARNVDYGHTDATLVSDYNVWVSAAAYRHKGAAATTLAGWRALGFDGNGRNCSAAFVDAPADLHLAPEDDCALDVGTDVSPLVTTDVDGDPRPQHGSPDIGADELAGDTGILLDDFETGDIRRWTPPGP